MENYSIETGISIKLKDYERYKKPVYTYYNVNISEYTISSGLSKPCIIIPFSKGSFGGRLSEDVCNLFNPHSPEEYVIASMSIIMNTRLNAIKKQLLNINALDFDSKTECLVFSTNKLTTYVTPPMYRDRNKNKLPSKDDVTIIFYSCKDAVNSAILLGLSHGCHSLIIPSDTESYVYTNILPIYENYFKSISLVEQPTESIEQVVEEKEPIQQPLEQQQQQPIEQVVKQPHIRPRKKVVFSVYKDGSYNTKTYSRYNPYYCNNSNKSSNIVKKSSVL